MKESKQNIIRIAAALLIVLVVTGIWFVKKNDEQKDLIGSDTDNPDFVLESSEIDLEQLKSYGLPIIIDFGADSCDACKEMAPILKELNSELQGKAIVKFVDVWKNPEAAEGFPLRVIPTQLYFDKNGNPYVPSDPQGMGMTMYQTDTKEHIYTTHEGGMTKEQFMNVLSEMGLEE